MNIERILKSDIQDFINKSVNLDITKLAFKKNPFPDVDYTTLINQIIAKKKAKEKLPTWFANPAIIFPEKISIEQTSSEITAKYKASLVSGNNLIDCTGGFGIDDYYFSKQFNKVIHCEINPELSLIVAHNFRALHVENVSCVIGDSTSILKNRNQKFDCIYVDPSRRNDAKGKVFMLKDCLPNVVELQNFYEEYSETLLIKTAPILDITAGLSELKNVTTIYIVAVENEVKELLWKIEKGNSKNPIIKAVTIDKGIAYSTEIALLKSYHATFSLPQKYLYEPNASLLKSGYFNAISELFGIAKLHQHSHLYTSNENKEFQGRKFKIIQEIKYQKQEMKLYIQNQKMNISTRNFPLKPEEIKKKFKIQDGGNTYAFFTTNLNNEKIVLLCEKI